MKGAVPPVNDIDIDPSFPPEQETGITELMLNAITFGWLMIKVVSLIHPLISIIFAEYEPACKADIDEVVCPLRHK